jgi:hypothetical protein
MREFKKKYTKNFHKIRKQKIMKSRKRSGGLSLPSLPSLPKFFKNKEKPPLEEYAPSGSLSENNEFNGDDNATNIEPKVRETVESNVQSIESQANEIFIKEISNTSDAPENWETEKITQQIDGKNPTIKEINDKTPSISVDYDVLFEHKEAIDYSIGDEQYFSKEKRKKYIEAENKYKEKRKEILTLLNQQPYSMTALLTSTKTLESIIEKGLANKKIPESMVSDLVRAKVDMKKAKNILDKSDYIINILFKNYDKFKKAQRAKEDAAWNARHFSQPKVQTSSSYQTSDSDYIHHTSHLRNRNADTSGSKDYDGMWGEDNRGGSKKRNTSKRHTKRHKRNNKKKYTKKTKQAH